MSSLQIPHILLVLDASPEDSGAFSFFHAWVLDLLSETASSYRVSLFYPRYSSSGPFYRLHREKKDDIERFFTLIPYRYPSFAETFSNSAMEALFSDIIKEGAFDAAHLFFLRNHSLGYPAIAYHAGLPVVLTVSDGWLLHPLRYLCKDATGAAVPIKLSNFVATPFSLFLRTFEEQFARRPIRGWFEEVGRYSRFYNKTPLSTVDEEILEERRSLIADMIPYVSAFHFFSPTLYNACYREMIPSDRVSFIPQGMPVSRVIDSRPFEIQRGLAFGFVGDLVPEEGVVELVEACNDLHERGFPSTLHLYGETSDNVVLVRHLKSLCRNPDVIFHGAVDLRRVGPVLDAIDAIIVPSLWPRSETWLAMQAMARRKIVIAPVNTAVADLIKKTRRGIVLKQVTADEIARTVADLEIDRKRVYYLMRVVEGGQFVSSSSNVRDLKALYESVSRKERRRDDETTLSRRLMRKRTARSRRKS